MPNLQSAGYKRLSTEDFSFAPLMQISELRLARCMTDKWLEKSERWQTLAPTDSAWREEHTWRHGPILLIVRNLLGLMKCTNSASRRLRTNWRTECTHDDIAPTFLSTTRIVQWIILLCAVWKLQVSIVTDHDISKGVTTFQMKKWRKFQLQTIYSHAT